MKTEALRVWNLRKTENGIPVLEGVNFHVFAGEMVAVIGLQYSGKSMLTDILTGVCQPDEGKILLNDRIQHFSGIADAQRAGIYCMRREPQLISSMSIAENFFVVNGNNRGVFSLRHLEAMAGQVLRHFGLSLDSRTPVRALPRTEQRKIELIKLALQKPKVIISAGDRDFDIREGKSFYGLFSKLLKMGISVVTFSNKLDDVVFMCDRVYPMREGIFGKSIPREKISRELLYRAMTGQTLTAIPAECGEEESCRRDGQELLAAKWLRTEEKNPPLNFRLHAGEVLGLIMPDSGHARAVADTLFGQRQPATGGLYLDGRPLQLRGPWDAIAKGIVVVPDRIPGEGVFDSLTLRENITMFALARTHRRFGFVPGSMSEYMARSVVEHYRIPTSGLRMTMRASRLRTGDRQKIAIARWALMRQSVYIFLNPFNNVDESLSNDLTEIFRELSAGGAGVLILSAGRYKLEGLCSRFIYCGGSENAELGSWYNSQNN